MHEISAPERPGTVNDLQSEGAATSETLEKLTGKRWISPAEIALDAGTQSRAGTHGATIQEYAQQMNDRLWQWKREPLPKLFWDGERFYPGDGHHRIMAAAIAQGSPDIYCEITEGTARDARFFSCGANRFHGLQRTNADKRNQVRLLLQDEEWQKMSDRAIAEHCGVSAPFVGKLRAELEAAGTVNFSSERIDKSGRKINTANIGTKPKQPQAEQEEQQPLETEAPGAPVSISTTPAPITQLPPQAQAPDPKASDSADRATQIKAEDVAWGGSSPRKPTQAQIRIEGEQSEDIDKLVQRLRQVLDIIEESRDYPNRGDAGMRRYLTVRM